MAVKIIVSLILALFLPLSASNQNSDYSAPIRSGLATNGTEFVLDGKPFRIFSGAMHYFRVPRAYWRDRLAKFKAAGLNTLETYVPWNLHEETRGNFNFQDNLDLKHYLDLAQEFGFKVLFRPGPYICAEWEWGGHPSWLLKDSAMKVRTLYSGYTAAVEAYLAKLIPLVVPYQYQLGGSIIAVQVENEYGAYGDNKPYLEWLRGVLTRSGIIEMFFTSDGQWWLAQGTLPGLYTVVNFQSDPEQNLNALKRFQPDKPLMVGEFWTGWFDYWGGKRHVWSAQSFKKALETILQMNSSVNFYMFHGGSNIRFMNGANRNYRQGKPYYICTIASYDYDAPLTEAGWITQKYFIVRDLMKQYNPDFVSDPALDALLEESRVENQVSGGGVVQAPQKYLTLTDAMTLVQPKQVDFGLVTMEFFGQNFGYIAYRTSLASGGVLVFRVVVADRLQIILNGQVVKTILSTIEFTESDFVVNVPSPRGGGANDLILLVENLGRVNYEQSPRTLDQERKGLTGNIHFNYKQLLNWNVYNLEMDPEFIAKVISGANWTPISNLQTLKQHQPSFYSIPLPLAANQIKDYFVDCEAWTKGTVFINNVNLGRYWNIGPQKTLYLPAAMLQTQNMIIILELERVGDALALVDYPNLGPPCEMWCP